MKKRLAKWSLLASSVLCVNIVSAQTTLLSSGTTTPLVDGQVLLSTNSAKPAKDIYLPFSSKGGTEYDVIRGVLNLESAAGGTVSQANAIGAYANCAFNSEAATYPGKGNCVALSGFSVASAQGANAWGVQAFCADNSLPSPYSGGGRSCTHELDIRIEDNTGTARGTGILLNLVGNGKSASTLIAADIQNNAGTLRWNFGVNCNNGAVGIACVLAGTSSAIPSSNVPSQAFAWQYFNSASTGVAMTMAASGTGGFIFSTTDTSITTAMDWSKVSIASCVLKLVAGCVLSGAGAFIAAAATPVAPAGTIGYGSTVVAPGANNCPVFAGGKRVDGCSVINVAGSYKVIPYFEWVSP